MKIHMFDECPEERLQFQLVTLQSQLDDMKARVTEEISFCNKLRDELVIVKQTNQELSRSYKKALSDVQDKKCGQCPVTKLLQTPKRIHANKRTT